MITGVILGVIFFVFILLAIIAFLIMKKRKRNGKSDPEEMSLKQGKNLKIEHCFFIVQVQQLANVLIGNKIGGGIVIFVVHI